jgi:hypothetical protein
MACVNPNSKEYKDLLRELGDPFDAEIEYIKRYGLVENVDYVTTERQYQESLNSPSKEKTRILTYVNAPNGFIRPESKMIADKEIVKYNGKYGADVLFMNKTVNGYFTIAINKNAKPYPKTVSPVTPQQSNIKNEQSIDNNPIQYTSSGFYYNGVTYEDESDILEEEVVEEPELEVPSHLNIDAQTYQNMVNMRRGSEPDMFISNGRKYVMNPRGYYNLIDQYTNDIILKDINLKTKQTILNFEQTVDLETLRDRKRYVIKVISTEVNENDLDIKLALTGLDINDLIEATIKATSMEQLNNVLDKLIEYKC